MKKLLIASLLCLACWSQSQKEIATLTDPLNTSMVVSRDIYEGKLSVKLMASASTGTAGFFLKEAEAEKLVRDLPGMVQRRFQVKNSEDVTLWKIQDGENLAQIVASGQIPKPTHSVD